MKTRPILNLWLLIAFVCLVVYIIRPFGCLVEQVPGTEEIAAAPLHAYNFWGLIIPVGLATLFTVLGGLTRRMESCRAISLLAVMMEIVSIAINAYIVYGGVTLGQLEWTWAPVLLVVALVLTFLAYRGVVSDMRKVRDADRIR